MKNIKVFIITLIAVIVVGLSALLIVNNGRKNDNKAEDVQVAEEKNTVSMPVAKSDNTVSEPVVEPEPEKPSKEAEYEGAERTSIVKTANEGEISISFAGDILFDRNYAIYSSYLNRGSDITACVSEDLLAKMHQADIMMINNEFPYSDRGAPQPNKTYTFRAATSSVKTLDELGVDIVSLANNHTFDYGEEAFLDTLTTLNNANMPFVGAGNNIDEASKPYYFVSGNTRIAVIAATQIERYSNPNTRGATENQSGVFRCLEPERLIETIKEAKKECDFVILYIHWGTESTDELDWCQEPQAKLYVEAGADIIIGDHPHVIQEIAYIDGTPVIYSLGNYWFNSKTMDSCIVTLTLNTDDASIKSLRFEPCLQSGCSVKLLHDADKARVISYMNGISKTAAIDDDGYVTEGDREGNRNDGLIRRTPPPSSNQAPPGDGTSAPSPSENGAGQ